MKLKQIRWINWSSDILLNINFVFLSGISTFLSVHPCAIIYVWVKEEWELSQRPLKGVFVWMCVCLCTQAGVGAVRVHLVSRSAGADEAGAIQVGAFMLAQLLLTVAVMAKIWSQTTWITFSDTIQNSFLSPAKFKSYLLLMQSNNGLVYTGRI